MNLDHYTHFTSPIRRYPDILVHRLLYEAVCHGKNMINTISEESKKSMVDIMEKCNECKMNARKVSDGCEKVRGFSFVFAIYIYLTMKYYKL